MSLWFMRNITYKNKNKIEKKNSHDFNVMAIISF
jgi:hypothetical protein